MSPADRHEFVVVGPGSFGAAIREFRHRMGLTQQAVAIKAQVHRSYLSSLETGSTTEALVQIVRTLDALGLEVVIRPRGTV
jgi:transcriptional regulator with XRE-family HTH domain